MSDRFLLTNRVAIVTGAGSGIGAAIARTLAEAGARVIAQDLNFESAQATTDVIQQANGIARAVGGDVSNSTDVASAVAIALEAFGSIDILVNNAGVQYVAPIDTYPLDQWTRLLAILLTGPFLFSQAVLPTMRAQKWGRIINIASVNGKRGDPGKAAYCSAKHGVIGLTRTAAIETAMDGITVNAICPGLVETPLIHGQLADLGKVHGLKPNVVIEKFFLPRIPIGRAIDPGELAALAQYLASDQAAAITGQTLDINGGLLFG